MFKQNSTAILMVSTRTGSLDLLRPASSLLLRRRAVARHKLRKNRRLPFALLLRIRENGAWTVRSSLPKWTQPGTPDGLGRNRFVSGDWKEASYPLRLLP